MNDDEGGEEKAGHGAEVDLWRDSLIGQPMTCDADVAGISHRSTTIQHVPTFGITLSDVSFTSSTYETIQSRLG